MLHKKIKKIAVILNNTYVAVIMLHHVLKLVKWRAHEVWVCTGVGGTKHYVPLVLKLKEQTCDILPAPYFLTWSDVINKIGTKAAAINTDEAITTANLKEFGRVESA